MFACYDDPKTNISPLAERTRPPQIVMEESVDRTTTSLTDILEIMLNDRHVMKGRLVKVDEEMEKELLRIMIFLVDLLNRC